MTPQQSAAALRLARTQISERDLQWHGEAAALLRELAAEQAEPVDTRRWTLLLVGPQNGIVGKYGYTFPASPDYYERLSVYAHPPQRKPLTPHPTKPHAVLLGERWVGLADVRAVEAAHGITEAP